MKILIKIIIIICLISTTFFTFPLLADEEKNNIQHVTVLTQDGDDYTLYLQKNSLNYINAASYQVVAGNYNSISNKNSLKLVNMFQNKENVLLCDGSSKAVSYTFFVKEAGYYSLSLNLFPINTDCKRIESKILINGKVPFSQAGLVYIYYNYVAENDIPKKNSSGDEYAARRIVSKSWTDCLITNPDNNYDGSMLFYLEKGNSNIQFEFNDNSSFALSTITLKAYSKIKSYKEYSKNAKNNGNKPLKIEAEKISRQSDSTVIPITDQTDPECSPRSVTDLKINVIGDSWCKHGQWLQWKIDVKSTGWYMLNIRYKQNSLKGINVNRCLYIDDEIPFQEASLISFPYSSSWKYNTVGDGRNPYLFYFTKGSHNLKLENVLGDLAEVIRDVDDIVYRLNSAYRSVIMITSTTADKYRDYQIEKELPNLSKELLECAKSLEGCNKKVEKLANGSSADSTILVTTSSQLRDMAKDPESVPFRLSSWESNIGSVSSWTFSIREQPLQLDYLLLSSPNSAIGNGKANFIKKIANSISRFAVSFIKDYNSMNYKDKNSSVITVWIGSGRDQAETVWQMANDMFTPETGIHVNVKLVSATMIEAFLSGQAPDVSIHAARDIPVNLAVRGALLNLSSFEGFNDVVEWFSNDALEPYTMQNCVYALPDTQNYNMLFYRTDVFNELQLSVPNTWDEFVNITNQLHLKQLDVGVPIDSDTSLYYTLLEQNGGKVFSNDLSTTLLDKSISIKSFNQWTDLFTETGLPLSYNFFNRFRSGEMPMAIVSYTNYNQLISAAPEIRNLWKIAEIPGTIRADGTINRSESASGTAAIILSSTKNSHDAWKFIKWWVSDLPQIRYAEDIESRVGTIGRVASANIKALEALDYPTEDKNCLISQRYCIDEVEEVPGNYYLHRDLLNAFRDVLYNQRNAKESIIDYSNRINSEIERKRKELGLD